MQFFPITDTQLMRDPCAPSMQAVPTFGPITDELPITTPSSICILSMSATRHVGGNQGQSHSHVRKDRAEGAQQSRAGDCSALIDVAARLMS
eukprot:754449-Hanusia_phi.AAC.2